MTAIPDKVLNVTTLSFFFPEGRPVPATADSPIQQGSRSK